MRHLEDSLQMNVVQYLDYQYPQLLYWHTPNGGKRNPREAARFRKMGVKAGVADIVLFWKDEHQPKWGAIELKAGKNSQTKEQGVFQYRCQWVGGFYTICRSLEEVIETLRQWRVPGVINCPSRLAPGAETLKYTCMTRGKK